MRIHRGIDRSCGSLGIDRVNGGQDTPIGSAAPVLSPAVTALQALEESVRREGTDVTGAGAGEEATRRYVRSPEDVLRLVVFASIAVLIAGFTVWFEESILGFEDDLLQLFGFVDSAAIRVVHGAIEIVSLIIGVTVYIVALSTRRYRLLGYVAVAAMVTFAVMSGIDWLSDRSDDGFRANDLLDGQAVGDSFVNGVVQISQLSAMFVVVRPFVGRQWRRAGIVTIVVLVLAELVISAQLPVDLFLALPIGAAIGTAVLLAFGRPDRHPTLAGIAAALHGAGLPVSGGPPGEGRRQGLDAVLRDPRRRHRTLRQGAGRPGTRRRPVVPRVPVPPTQERG